MFDVCVAILLLAARGTEASSVSDDQPAFAVIELPTRSPNFEETRGELLRLRRLTCTAWADKRTLDIWVLHAGVDASSREKVHLGPSSTGGMIAEVRFDTSLLAPEAGEDSQGTDTSTRRTYDRMVLIRPDKSEVEVRSRADCAAIDSAPVVLRNTKTGATTRW